MGAWEWWWEGGPACRTALAPADDGPAPAAKTPRPLPRCAPAPTLQCTRPLDHSVLVAGYGTDAAHRRAVVSGGRCRRCRRPRCVSTLPPCVLTCPAAASH